MVSTPAGMSAGGRINGRINIFQIQCSGQRAPLAVNVPESGYILLLGIRETV